MTKQISDFLKKLVLSAENSIDVDLRQEALDLLVDIKKGKQYRLGVFEVDLPTLKKIKELVNNDRKIAAMRLLQDHVGILSGWNLHAGKEAVELLEE